MAVCEWSACACVCACASVWSFPKRRGGDHTLCSCGRPAFRCVSLASALEMAHFENRNKAKNGLTLLFKVIPDLWGCSNKCLWPF